jgi:hypothetical protein
MHFFVASLLLWLRSRSRSLEVSRRNNNVRTQSWKGSTLEVGHILRGGSWFIRELSSKWPHGVPFMGSGPCTNDHKYHWWICNIGPLVFSRAMSKNPPSGGKSSALWSSMAHDLSPCRGALIYLVGCTSPLGLVLLYLLSITQTFSFMLITSLLMPLYFPLSCTGCCWGPLWDWSYALNYFHDLSYSQV